MEEEFARTEEVESVRMAGEELAVRVVEVGSEVGQEKVEAEPAKGAALEARLFHMCIARHCRSFLRHTEYRTHIPRQY